MLPEIEFASEPAAVCDSETVNRIRRAAAESPRLRARLCLHPDTNAQLHEMIIVLRRGTAIPIHRHPDKAECYHILQGRMTLKIYDEDGRLSRQTVLEPFGGQEPFVCRIPAGLWHTVEVESDEVVLHESTTGPFSPSDTEYLSRT